MKLIDLLIDLRRDVLNLIEGIDDAGSRSFGWDRTRTNTSTQHLIDGLLKSYISKAAEFGIYVVTRHSQCGLAGHTEYFLVEDEGQQVAKYEDEAFDWTGVQLYQGDRVSVCPCTPVAPPREHHVIDEFVIRKMGATRRHPLLVAALSHIQYASEQSTDRRARAAILEHLLRAVLELNDGILPQSVDQYIAASDVGTGSRAE